MTESLSPTILSSISNLINYSNLQTVLLDIVKVVEGLSRDVATVKATILHLGEDKVNKSEFNVFVGAMAALQGKVDGLEGRFRKASEDASGLQQLRKDTDSQFEKMKQQMAEMEAKINKTRIASFSSPTSSSIDPEEIRKLQLQLAQKVDVDTFQNFKEQTLKNEQNHITLKRSVTDVLDSLNSKAASSDKYETEMRERQQHFFDTLKLYDDKLLDLASLKEKLDSKLDIVEYESKSSLLEQRISQDLDMKEEQIKELYNALRKKADITQLMELEQILNAYLLQNDGGTAVGRSQFKCLSCDRSYSTLSGSGIDTTTLSSSLPSQRKNSAGATMSAPNTLQLDKGKKMMVLGSDGVVYQGRDTPSPAQFGYEVDVEINTIPQTARNRPPSPMTSSRNRTRPQSAKRF